MIAPGRRVTCIFPGAMQVSRQDSLEAPSVPAEVTTNEEHKGCRPSMLVSLGNKKDLFILCIVLCAYSLPRLTSVAVPPKHDRLHSCLYARSILSVCCVSPPPPCRDYKCQAKWRRSSSPQKTGHQQCFRHFTRNEPAQKDTVLNVGITRYVHNSSRVNAPKQGHRATTLHLSTGQSCSSGAFVALQTKKQRNSFDTTVILCKIDDERNNSLFCCQPCIFNNHLTILIGCNNSANRPGEAVAISPPPFFPRIAPMCPTLRFPP